LVVVKVYWLKHGSRHLSAVFADILIAPNILQANQSRDLIPRLWTFYCVPIWNSEYLGVVKNETFAHASSK